jgi:hypothetical protein
MLSLETIKCINYMLIDIKLNFTKLYWTSLIKGLKFIKNLKTAEFIQSSVIWGFHGSEYVDHSPLSCNAM